MILLIFLSFLVFLILGIPVAISIGLTSLVTLQSQGTSLMIIPQRMFSGTDSFPLVAVPFFILGGELLARGRVSERLVQFAESLLGSLKGGLWVVAVMASMFFAAISGSGAATTAAVATPLIPELKKKKYSPEYSAALIASGGCCGVVIPPSVPMILYAVIAEQSVARLFLNGFLPGLLMGLVLIVIALVIANKNNYPAGERFSIVSIWKNFKGAIWGIMMPVIILGGIFSGYFTPSEAAVVSVVWALFVALFIYKDMTYKDIFEIFTRSAITMSVIMFIISTSTSLSWILANWKIPTMIADSILSISQNTFILLLLINIVILLAGIFMETASALIILTPVFLPIIDGMGVSRIHFGIIMVLGLAIGMITPPVAINLYVASTVSKISMERISKAVVPFLIGLLFVLLLVTYIPMFFNVIL